MQKNPRPKIKQTRRQAWTKQSQTYKRWKAYVQNNLLAVAKEDDRRAMVRRILSGKKPLNPDEGKVYVHLHFYFKGENHGDPENVFGSIVDALFQDDKHIVGSWDFDHVERFPRVYVEILWGEHKEKQLR